MIEESDLKILLEKYGIDSEKVLKSKTKVLKYCDYNETSKILEYLINDLKIYPQRVEKTPSILCFSNKENIQKNYEYLISQGISLKKISFSLSVLSTPNDLLIKNFEYIVEHLDKSVINSALSTLAIPHSDIRSIITKFDKAKLTNVLIKYPITISNIVDNHNIEEIDEILSIPFFKNNPNKLTSSVFLRTKAEIDDVLDLPFIKENPNRIKGTIFQRTAKEIDAIVNLPYFQTHKEKLTTSVFHRKPEEVINILEIPYFASDESRITPSIFLKTPTELKKITSNSSFQNSSKKLSTAVKKNSDEIEVIINLPYFISHPECLKSTTFRRGPLEIEKIINLDFFKKYPDKLTPCVFLRTESEILDIINMPYFKDHPERVAGSIFHSTKENIEKLLEIDYFKQHPEELKGVVFRSNAKDLKESISFIKNELELPAGVDICKPLVFVHKKEHIREVVEFLRELDENLIAALSTSAQILNLSLEEIKARTKFILDNNMPVLLKNGQFNSILGMPKKRFEQKFGITIDALKSDFTNQKIKRLTIKKAYCEVNPQ